MKHFIIITILATFCYRSPAQNLAKQNSDAEKFIRATMDSLHLPGLAVGVVKHGKVLKLSTYGKANLDWQTAVDAHTNFQIASVSKLLASTLMMKSIYNNKINLDDEVSRFVDSIPPSWKGMKVRHLLTHTSGIKVFKQDNGAPVAKVIRALRDSTLSFPYGTKQDYVSGDYTILLYIFEQVYKKPYPQIIKDEITGPMSMNDGAFDRERNVSGWIETDVVRNKASTYYVKNGTITPYKFGYPHFTYTAGGYFASVTDFINWAVALDKEVLFPKSIEMKYAYTPEIVNGKPTGFSNVGWGISTVNGITVGGHSGGPAFGDVERFPQQGITVIVLTNDGELLPYFANAISTFYIDNLPFGRKVTKFKRTGALQ